MRPDSQISDCETTMAVARKACLHPRPGVHPMSGIICSHGGRTNGEGIFFCIDFCLLKAVQSKKALLPMYLSEGGIASSTGAAQFIKALTRIVWRVLGRRTSLRLVQCTKVNRNFLNIGVAKVYTLKQSATVARMCSNSHKMLCESECGDSRRVKTVRCELTGPSLQC